MKVIMIVPFFGETPLWIDYFLTSCNKNSNIDWLIYGDIELDFERWDNIQAVRATIDDFNNLASLKLGFSVTVIYPYKICDFKPTFGKVFSDFIENYDFWGYCDLDLIFGNINYFVKPDCLKEYDIITTKINYVSGHFTLLRNNAKMRNLYKKIWRVKHILRKKKKHYAIDELSNLIGQCISPARNKKNIINKSIHRAINSIRYRIFKSIRFSYDFTKVVSQSEEKGEIKVLRLDCIKSDIFYLKQNINNWVIEWNEGNLYDYNSNKFIMYFHFIKSKENRLFHISPINNQTNFILTEKGINN